MAETTNRQKRAQEMRMKIQTVALELFDQKGFENVSIEEIAKEVGCSVGNIYHYFPNKAALKMQVTDRIDAAYEKIDRQYQDEPDRTYMDKLIDFVGQTLTVSVNDTISYPVMMHALKYPEQGELKIDPKRAYFRVLRELITGCQEEGSLPAEEDPDELVNDLATIHRGVLLEWRIMGETYKLEDAGQKIAGAFLRGLSRA